MNDVASIADDNFLVEYLEREDVLIIRSRDKSFNYGTIEIPIDEVEALLFAIGRETGERIVVDRPTETVVQMEQWLRGLVKETDDESAKAQLEALADGVLEHVYTLPRNWWDTAPSPTTTSSGVGPVTLDIDMARRHGWRDGEIVRALDILHTLSRMQSREVAFRNGLTRECKACECWTTPRGECHLCVPREIGRVCENCHGKGETRWHSYGMLESPTRCTLCNGEGRVAT